MMRHTLLLFFWLIGSSVNYGSAGDYLWPTDASKIMSSSFCEFRPRHYHAAIDIKTWNQTGYKIFAIEDGYVMRIRVSAFGYGKAVYLKLKDGNIVVYAHLENFTPELEKFVNDYRHEHQQNRVDLHLNSKQFPVKKGQYLGNTGRTGIGVPHLHFEMRDKNNHPTNPLKFYPKVIDDRKAPLFYELAIIPHRFNSRVNGLKDTVFIDLKRTNHFTIKDTLNICGTAALALKSNDHANGARNKFAFYQAKLWIDDSLAYSVQYDKFSYARSKLIELDDNFSLWRKKRGIFHNFFKHPKNKLKHYGKTATNGGLIDAEKLKPGLHSFKIMLRDFAGNESYLTSSFKTEQPFHLKYDLNNRLEGDLFLRVTTERKVHHFKNEHNSNNPHRNNISQPEILSSFTNNALNYYTLSLPKIGKESAKIVAYDSAGNRSFPLFFDAVKENRNSAKPSLSLSKIEKNALIYKLHSGNGKAQIFIKKLLHKYPEIEVFAEQSGIFTINVPQKNAVQFYSEFKKQTGTNRQDFQLVKTNAKSVVKSKDGYFIARFPAGALYDPTIVTLKYDNRNLKFPDKIHRYPELSARYQLSPFDQPVKEGIEISLQLPDSVKFKSNIGLYYFDIKKGWIFIPSQIDSVSKTFRAKVTSFETFVLISDSKAARLVPGQKINGTTLKSRQGLITFVLEDEFSGIYKESQIDVYLNGKWHLFEYDPEENLLIIRVPQSNKTMDLKINITDNAGNFLSKNYEIKY